MVRLFDITLSTHGRNNFWHKIYFILRYSIIVAINIRFLGKPSEDSIKFLLYAYPQIFKQRMPIKMEVFYYLYGKLIRIYESNGVKAGFALFRMGPVGNMHLSSFGLIDAFRGKGLAELFLSDCLQYWKMKGFKSTSLLVETANRRAIKVYEKLDFQPIKLYDSLLYMAKDL